MAARSDISAGRAFVELYVRDYAFRRRLAEDESLFENVGLRMKNIGSDTSPMDMLYGSSADDILHRLYSDTDVLTEATWDLTDALQVLMDQYVENDVLRNLYDDTEALTQATWELESALDGTLRKYLDMSGLQQDGITLNVADRGPLGDIYGGGDAYGGSEGAGDTYGEFDKEQLGAGLKEGLEDIPKEMSRAIAWKVGGALADSKAAKELGGRLAASASRLPAIGGLFQRSEEEGETGTGTGMGGTATTSSALLRVAEAADKAANALFRLTTSASGSSMGGLGGIAGSGSSMGGLGGIADSADDVVMAELAEAGTNAGGGMTNLAAGATTATAAMGPLLAAAAVAVPLLAGLNIASGDALSKSGMYPKWLQFIGEAMLAISPPLQVAVVSMKALWVAFKVGIAVIKPFVKVALLPMKAALLALKSPFIAFKLAVASIRLPFVLARKAITGTIKVIKALPGVAVLAVKGVKRLTAGVVNLSKAMASGAWKAWSASINAVSSGLSRMGKVIGVAGGAMAAFGAAITVPLSRAAKQFQQHGDKVDLLTQRYRHLGLSAEDASVYLYAASQASGELGAMGEEERIKNIMASTDRGSEAFKEWRKQAEMSGQLMGGSMVASASLLSAAYKRMREALSGLWRMLGAAVAPAITDTTEVMVGAIRAVTQWVKENQGLIRMAFKVAGAIGAAGTVIAAAGGALITLGSALSPITALLAAVAGGMAIVEYRTKAGATFIGSYKDSVMKMYDTIRNILPGILKHFQDTFGGITDAIKGGDLKLAAQIAWVGLKIAWLEGLSWLAERTGGVFGGILADLAGGNWRDAADKAMSMVRDAFEKARVFVINTWTDIKNKADTKLTEIAILAGRAWLGIRDQLDPIWLWIKDMFEEMKIWGSQAFAELGVYAAGLSAAFKHVASVLKPILLATAAMSPALAASVAVAIKGMDAIRSGAAEAFKEATAKAKVAINVATRPTDAKKQREELADKRKKQRGEAFAKWEEDMRRASQSREDERLAAIENIGDAEEANAEAAAQEEERQTKISQAMEESAKAQAELARLRKEASDKAKLAAQPDSIDAIRGTSSLITSSAYAFGQYGNQQSPQKAMVDEVKQQREEAKERGKEAQKIGERVMTWMDENPNLVAVLENLGFFANG